MRKVLIICLTFMVPACFAISERDIHHAQLLVSNNIIVDRTDAPELYRFDDTITRAELVGVALMMHGIDIPEDYRCREYYDDVHKKTASWICRAVELAAKEKLISRVNDLFRPQAQITRAEAYAILLESSDLDYRNNPDLEYQALDHDIVDWQKKLYARLIDAQIPIPRIQLPEIQASDTTEQEILFPVQGKYGNYVDSFGDPRWGGRTHIGTDISAAKMTPLVAVVDGKITFAPRTEKSWGYAIYLKGENKYTYKYLHVNNDTPGTDDGNGGTKYAYAPGIREGSRVKQGDIIGYLGDSGNAENTGAHLHFEISGPNGEIINPYATLKNAQSGSPSVQFFPNTPITRSEVFEMVASMIGIQAGQ